MPGHGLREYKLYRQCTIERDGEQDRVVWVFAKFARVGKQIYAIKQGVGNPSDDPVDPNEWEHWTISEVSETTSQGSGLTQGHKRQTLVEWTCRTEE
jgi:hypothetical protein